MIWNKDKNYQVKAYNGQSNTFDRLRTISPDYLFYLNMDNQITLIREFSINVIGIGDVIIRVNEWIKVYPENKFFEKVFESEKNICFSKMLSEYPSFSKDNEYIGKLENLADTLRKIIYEVTAECIDTYYKDYYKTHNFIEENGPNHIKNPDSTD